MRIICCQGDTSIKWAILHAWDCDSVPSPTQRPEPGQVVGMVHAVADGDDFLEALNLNAEDLHTERDQGLTCV